MYKRLIFKKGVPDASFFLFGPRQTGKTTFIESIPTSLHYNLLRSADFLRLNKDPDILFDMGSATLKPGFKDILKNFIPKQEIYENLQER